MRRTPPAGVDLAIDRARLLVVGLLLLAGCGDGDGAERTRSTTTVEVTTTPPTVAPGTSLPVDGDELTGVVVVIDPGHNGGNAEHTEEIARLVDAGGFSKECNTTGTASDSGYPESRFNFETALLVRARLEALGASVQLTREDDDGWGPCIDERGLLARRAGADLLVSIHADGGAPSDHGFHVIHPAPREGYVDRATAEQAAELAVHIRDQLTDRGLVVSTYRGSNGLDQRDDLGTLNRAGTPAVIVESGNMRNAEDVAMLTSPEGRALLADALVAAVAAWFGSATPG